MPNKSILAIIAILILTMTAMLTKQETTLIYLGIAAISALGGVAIWKNSLPKK